MVRIKHWLYWSYWELPSRPYAAFKIKGCKNRQIHIGFAQLQIVHLYRSHVFSSHFVDGMGHIHGWWPVRIGLHFHLSWYFIRHAKILFSHWHRLRQAYVFSKKIERLSIFLHLFIDSSGVLTEITVCRTERQTDRQTERQTDRQTDRETDRRAELP